MTLYKWSQTPASNATADSTINWAEGQAPSSVNDSARAMMTAAAKYRDDIAGAIATGGTSTAYTVTSYQVFDTLAHLNGQMIAFVPNATNTNAVGVDVTLNVDGLGAKPVRIQPSVAIPNGTLVLGTPYIAVYNNSDAVFYLHNMVNPYQIPLSAGMDFWGSTAPNTSFAFPIGQQISQTTYATLYALFGPNRYGADGGGLFYLPDKRERVSVMKTSSASRLTATYFGGDSTALGAVGGSESQTLTQLNLPNITPTFTGTAGTVNVTTTTSDIGRGVVGAANSGGGTPIAAFNNAGFNSSATSSGSFTPAGTIGGFGGNTPHNNVQPTIVCNYIMRII